MERRAQETWHVGREIPIALLVAFIIQTGGIVWWAATFQADFKNLVRQVDGIAIRQFTQKDGMIMIADSKSKDIEHDWLLTNLEARVKDAELKLREIERAIGRK